ncbi:hypothetical protein [Halorussus sp. MSC15.2]|uniref:hypothetical protein n=1 Tax=Halorussus sp. MSC15.2 TaxID=2283638 RepID=UPI0013D6728D|nr:hypothetical protein [Halorussus sp. MSC15.2]NEU58189.1 hypothetical protein [Halorussus sp. MSC15.2]
MSTHPRFRSLTGATGLDVIDPIETRHFSLSTDSPVSPSETDPDEFAFPVATACRIRTGRLSFSYAVPMDVRTPEGDHRSSIDLPMTTEFPADEYLLELHSPIKIYLRVDGAMSIDATDDGVVIEFGDEVTVTVGARSYHSSPAATITVPDDPEAMMEAVSAFPSALKTTSPERAWPTLRGHPPRVERGDELVIPDELDVPETGITISVPPEYGYVYTVAPLAYYLGAEVLPGETASLTADSEEIRHLGDDVASVGESVEEILKRVLLLDCVTRTEGLYPDDLHERDVLETHTDLDFAALYDAPPADRLGAYLAVSDEAMAAIDSPWHRITHVEEDPGPDPVELLPYVVNDLSLVRVKQSSDDQWSPTESQRQTGEALESFVRSPTPADGEGDFLRSASLRRSVRRNDGMEASESPRENENTARGVPGEGGYMPLPDVDALEQAWIGDRTPVEGTKLLKEAFEHDTPDSEDGSVEITVVCNDAEMRAELESAAEIYDDRDDLRADVSSEFDVTTDELRDLFAEESDMFHFVGHIDGLGFQCSDGILDAATLDETNAKTVLLNGCRSHDQGVELVRAGASAAVVSLGDLWNEGAVEVGETLAKLFFHGFSIGHAMTIVREYTSIGKDYVVVGDPGETLTYSENILPCMYHINQETGCCSETSELAVEAYSYPIRNCGIGSTFRTHLPEVSHQHIAVGAGQEWETTLDGLRAEFQPISEPLIVNGELKWTDTWLNT